MICVLTWSIQADHLKRSEIFHELIGGAAQQILGAAFGINASFTDVLDVSLDKQLIKPDIMLLWRGQRAVFRDDLCSNMVYPGRQFET